MIHNAGTQTALKEHIDITKKFLFSKIQQIFNSNLLTQALFDKSNLRDKASQKVIPHLSPNLISSHTQCAS